jgi:hypothetical protein
MERFSFELTFKGGAGRPFKRQVTVEAANVYHAWRRMGGQLVNTREGREVMVGVKLLDRPVEDGPVISKRGRRAALAGF